ncbi:hypothetical protein LJX78_05720 [Methanimicrococcus blatticola]|uniref:hypothetical protein n=1 Tax=Methanimicrococcus blatticola TaxID=91560 RepID=UPI00105E162D|nr:hypothetical protein [Methanimicrococcus blatticola]MBZ3935456.1 hypothetical protein [Methanimicrococcus blatticola]MCC2509100.1 hypothetical protein [Methanimicrococcus blatticola]
MYLLLSITSVRLREHVTATCHSSFRCHLLFEFLPLPPTPRRASCTVLQKYCETEREFFKKVKKG